MADPLMWRDGEGYDIHVLRGGPPSKPLVDSLILPAGTNAATSLSFAPQFAGAPKAPFVEVDTKTGSVTAKLHTDAAKPKIFNFLMTASLANPAGGAPSETEIRVHVHDPNITEIWLTPATLTIHQGADECRFTVLARFDDECVADITDWDLAQFTFNISDQSAVKVLARGKLQAVTPGVSSDVTATLKITTPAITKTTPPAKVFTRKSWAETANNAQVVFVAGKTAPNPNDLDSVKSVVDSAMNILFVAEGFRQEQRGDFNNYVAIIAQELRTQPYLMPFPILKDSINFWSVFVPSQEDSVTLLGDYFFTTGKSAALVPRPRVPESGEKAWKIDAMIHEVGLPAKEDLEFPLLSSQVLHWQKLYGTKVTEEHTTAFFYKWWLALLNRLPLNERDTAFGMTLGERTRVSYGGRVPTHLLSAQCQRRASDASIATFVENLTFGKAPSGDLRNHIGATWKSPKGKDAGLVCFICQSDRLGGTQNPQRYFTSSTGQSEFITLRPPAGLGRSFETAAMEKHSRTVVASNVAHECGHALGLGDEYGGNQGVISASVLDVGNLLAKTDITTTTTNPSTGATSTVFNKTKDIKWLWPRVIKSGVLAKLPERSETGFRVTLRKGHSSAFRVGDMVWFREWPVVHVASRDPFLGLPRSMGLVYKVKLQDDGGVNVDLEDSSGAVVDLDAEVTGVDTGGTGPVHWADIIRGLFSQTGKYALICPRTEAGVELKLIAPPIFNHIQSYGPLSAEPGFDPALCVSTGNAPSIQSPTNLPTLSNAKKLIAADIIGIFEGGGYHDCGVYRPAGRCKMRSGTRKLVPFCHVCRYLIVDRVDPTKHFDLDEIYAKEYPQP
jgi:fructose-specific component phosphotransferase system IIB-like protein